VKNSVGKNIVSFHLG